MDYSPEDVELPQPPLIEEDLTTEDVYTTLYVHVYPSPLFAAHWSFFLPRQNATSEIGDRVHVTGDRLNGFNYEYIRDYNPKEDSRRPNAFPIGRVVTTARSSPWPDGSQATNEENGRTMFDYVCQQVAAPGPGLNSASAGDSAPKRREVRDCQWWIKQAVARLIDDGMLLPLGKSSAQTDAPLARVNSLPKH